MQIEIDPDVCRLAVFTQNNYPASRLVPITEGFSAVGGILWKRYGREENAPVTLSQVTLPVETAPADASQ
jgi:hypothetical protein